MPTELKKEETTRRTAREPKPTKKGEGYAKQLQQKNKAKDVDAQDDVDHAPDVESSSTTTTDVAVATVGTKDIATDTSTAAILDANDQHQRKIPPEQLQLNDNNDKTSQSTSTKPPAKKRTSSTSSNKATESTSNNSGTKRDATSLSSEPPGKKKRSKKQKKQGSSIASGKITSSALPHIDKLIPDAFKACTTGWVEKDITTSAYTIVSEDDFVEKYLGHGLVETYEHIAKSMGQHLRTKGQECNAVNALNALIQLSTFEDIASHTTEELVKKGHDYVSGYELRRFFATKLLCSRFDVSTQCAWERFMVPLS